jgi:hypothetical protein
VTLPDTPNTKGRRRVRPVSAIDVSPVPVDQAETLVDFARCLDQVRILAGPLSHREIESRSGGILTRTKIGQVLNGDLPRREFLVAYLEVCGVPASDRPLWLEMWGRLAQTAKPRGVPTRREAQERATTIIEKAETEAREIIARAQAEVDALRAHARMEAQRARQADDVRIAGAEEERDAALARARSLTLELDAMHETSLQRIRAADEERDTALARAHDLAVELSALHESSLQRIRIAEDQRDTALARANAVDLQLEAAQRKIDELREQLGHLQEAQKDRAWTGQQQDDAADRYAPPYLVDANPEVFRTDQLTTPPVIGE